MMFGLKDKKMEKKIQIEGLTEEQSKLLTMIWHIDTYEEMREFRAMLIPEQQMMMDSLMTLIMHEFIEMDIREMDYYPDAEEIIERIRNGL
jgi:hypothetical protein